MKYFCKESYTLNKDIVPKDHIFLLLKYVIFVIIISDNLNAKVKLTFFKKIYVRFLV